MQSTDMMRKPGDAPRVVLRMRRVLAVFLGLLGCVSNVEAQEVRDFKAPPHSYWERQPKDAVTVFLAKVSSGEIKIDASSEHSFVRGILDALKVPVSSQLLVYSATSMQSERINPRNPRALYYNEDVYVGVVPGGRVEMIGVDPEMGGVFYLFDPPRAGLPPRAERSTRCFNCARLHLGIRRAHH
jgi:hypothetical protein